MRRRAPEIERKLNAAAGLDAHPGVIDGGRYARIKVKTPKQASLPAACSTPT